MGATVATVAALGLLCMMTSPQQASAATLVSASALPSGFGLDKPPVPTGAPEMPMGMPGMDMSGSSPTPSAPAEMPMDMPGMDMSGTSPTPTVAPDAPGGMDMPGMDMPGDSHGHDDAAGTAGHRPIAPVLGTFGGATSAVLLSAGMLRRKDRAASLVRNAARDAGRSGR